MQKDRANPQIGRATYMETMDQFQGQILPPNHPISRRVRTIAKRIVERNGLGVIKEGHTLSTIEEVMGAWSQGRGMETAENIDATEGPSTNAEWEVSRGKRAGHYGSSAVFRAQRLTVGLRCRRQEDDERICHSG